MAAFSFAKILFVASLLVLVISSDATRPAEQATSADIKRLPPSGCKPPPPVAATPPPKDQESPCMKHKLMTENLCHDMCSNVGYQTHHFISFNAVDSDSICCCCAAGSNCNIPSFWA